MDESYINEVHLQAFQRALDYQTNEEDKITSMNDWTPIHMKLKPTPPSTPTRQIPKSKKQRRNVNEYSQSLSFRLFRYPLLFFILSWCGFLFVCYVLLRLYIAFFERSQHWLNSNKKHLFRGLKASKNYNEWVNTAQKLDEYLKLNQWKVKKLFYYYDYRTLQITTRDLRRLREGKNINELLITLKHCVRSNFGGTENSILYSQTYYGTKTFIEEYNKEVQLALEYVIEDQDLPATSKFEFFKNISSNFGKTTLCLSGGATFAYNHFGVVKALLEQDLLPDIISGTSGGGIVAALTATRTNDELKKLIKPELAQKITACCEPFSVYSKRFLKTGARFDSIDWARKAMFFTRGSMTFKEAYQLTGKVLNISTVPADPHSPVILCNHITSPNCVIWSAVLASSAVPGILNPVVLMNKDPKTGELTPFSFGSRFKDGSLRTDIPLESLNTYFNTKFSIVSQVNPHISIFQFSPRGSVGSPVLRRNPTALRGGFIGAGLISYIKLENTKWFKFIKSLDLMPNVMEQDWSNLWLQRFSGTVTIYPKMKITDLYYILTDPDEERLERMIRNGEISTYPKLKFIKDRLSIERLIMKGLRHYRATVRCQRKVRNGFGSGLDSPVVSDDEHITASVGAAQLNSVDSIANYGLQYQQKFEISPERAESEDYEEEEEEDDDAFDDEYEDVPDGEFLSQDES